jgi:glycerophosphoryl diester phosphodiesterase
VNIELKTKSLRKDGLTAEVVRLVEDNNLSDRVIVSSFDPFALRSVRQANPTIPVGLLYSPDQPLVLRRAWLHRLVRPDALHPHCSMVDAGYVRWAKERGYRLHVWTVDEPDEMRRLVADGVDAIITNRPDLLRVVLQGERGG